MASFITPLIAAIGGKPDFSALAFTINGSRFAYGAFFNALLSFLIIAAVVFFLIVRPLNALMAHRSTEEPVAEVTRDVPGVPVEDPRRRPPLRVLHGGGRGCLSSASGRAPRRRTRSGSRASCASRPAARRPRRATCS